MAVKIEKKIVGYALVNEQDKKDAEAKAAELAAQKVEAGKVVQLGEPLSRPDKLVGNT
jgi:hypothetical protein